MDYFTRAEIYIALERYEEAISDIESGLQAPPQKTTSDRWGYKALGKLYRKQGKINLAIKAYSDGIGLVETTPVDKYRRIIPLDDYFVRAQLYTKVGEIDKAIVDYEKILSYKPTGFFCK